jgi:hypothetical protein
MAQMRGDGQRWRIAAMMVCASLVCGVAWADDGDKAESKKEKAAREKAEEEKKKEDEKKAKETKETAEKVLGMVKKYFDTNLRLPTSLAELTQAPNPVTSSVPKDAWGKPFSYRMGEYSFEKQDFDVTSAGADGKPGTADDIKVSNSK